MKFSRGAFPLHGSAFCLRVGLRSICAALLALQVCLGADSPQAHLKIPRPGDHELKILSPTLLELTRINYKPPDPAPIENWNWVNSTGYFAPPDLSKIVVLVNGQTGTVSGAGFKRRPVYAPLDRRDLRVGNYLYLKLQNPISEGQSVTVLNDGSLWPTNFDFRATADPLRFNPAIHVNQEGYLPSLPKHAIVGYYLGSLGEMPIPSTNFAVVLAGSGQVVHQGNLTLRRDLGYLYTPTPYQVVYEADFSGLTNAGEYQVTVPGLGTSMPFRIDDGMAMNLARTYALGIFHQRSGFNVGMPFTRYTHGADHLAPALVPKELNQESAFTWKTIAEYASRTNFDNPPQLAPRLTSPETQLYPYVNPGPVDVHGGHFEAANYSKVTWNNAQTVHILAFAADAFPGVGVLDNLGLPESGDGISDVLQEAKWEADALVRSQDADGGFYYMIHPRQREYEYDVLPENGDPQVVWPKNTASTASAVAALVQLASSPAFKQAYPEVANQYWEKALLGWNFLTNAFATHGRAGAYQRIMHFDDSFTHNDDVAWAACEFFLATGNPEFRGLLEEWMPDPTSPATMRWGWWGMYACYGNAIRSYATAVRSGRLQPAQLNPDYLAKCVQAITNYANLNLKWSRENAYGTSFPDSTKRVRDAGWYYSTEQAFDLAVAHLVSPAPEYLEAILRNVNYETGCNPINVCHVTGLGWKRHINVVDQYSANDRRVLPKIGVPIGNIQAGFVDTWTYGDEPYFLTSPPDGAEEAPYPFYDRWCDFWNVSTEASTINTARSYATCLYLTANTQAAGRAWRFTPALIRLEQNLVAPGAPVKATLSLPESNLAGAKLIWEAQGQEPAFGGLSHSLTAGNQPGSLWIEAEVHWPDGRRAFAMGHVQVQGAIINGPPRLMDPLTTEGGEFSFLLGGEPQTTYRLEASTNMVDWSVIATHTLPNSGVLRITPPGAGGVRFFRVVTP